MKRRGFLSALGAAAGAFALDPERALWVPGAKLISIPRPRPVVRMNVVYRAWPIDPAEGLHPVDRYMVFDERGRAHFVQRYGYPPETGLPRDVRAQLAHLAGVDPERLVLNS